MTGVANPNINTYTLDPVAVTARNAEYPTDVFDDAVGDGTFADPYLGGNRAGSCAPGIGINTGDVNPKLDDWTVLDQGQADAGATPLARNPQDSQHIGGDAFVDRVAAAIPFPGSGGTEGLTDVYPVKTVDGADVNDDLAFVVAVVAAVAGAGVGALGADPLNLTGETIAIGDRIWGINENV